MSVESVTARARARAEQARMTSRCTIRRKTGATTTDPTTGFKVPVWDAIHTALPLRVASNSDASQSRRIETAGVEFQVAMSVAHLPAGTSDLRDGDLIEVTAGEGAGSVLRVVDAALDLMQRTARRVPVAATQRPEEW